MYLGTLHGLQGTSRVVSAAVSVAFDSGASRRPKTGETDWLEDAIRITWHFIVRALKSFGAWLIDFAPSLTWTAIAFNASYTFVHHHPHPFHILFWSIFLGPIIILLPGLILIEILTLLLYNLSFISHGFVSGSPEDNYEKLKDYFMDSREGLFAIVEDTGNVYNKWTSAHIPLLVTRLIAGALGLFILIGLWTGW